MIEIFHVSDLHFGKSDSQNDEANFLLEGINRQFPFKDNKNRYLLVTGDITDTGDEDEYELAGQALLPFEGRIFITPGNHDYGSPFGIMYSEHKAKYFDNPFASDVGFSHSFFNKTVFRFTLKDPSSESSLIIIGLNSCAKKGLFDLAQGEVGENQRKELAEILKQCDSQTPKLLFLHHIPNKVAEWEFVMTLRDWKELMTIVKGRIDVLTFGHQGKSLEVEAGLRKKSMPLQDRSMQVRSFGTDDKLKIKSDGKRILVLDANASVQDKKFYCITLSGHQPTACVVSVE